jgi:hypothetical protein
MLTMKTILICPNQTTGIPVLAESTPIANLPLIGESFVGYWLEHLASRQATEVRLITSDDPEKIREIVGNGSRWGINLEIFHEVRDLSAAEARKRYRPDYETDWLPEDVIEADHLPGLPEHKLYSSYANWFTGLSLWLPFVCQSNRIGMRQIQDGVWAGRRTKIGEGAQLRAPCWLGDNVRIGKNSIIGPFAFIENQVVVDQSAEIANSWIGPDTFVGTLTRVHESLGWGSLLINWKSGSHILVPDSFLMSSLTQNPRREAVARLKERTVVAAKNSPLVRPIEAVISLAQKLQS